MALTPAVSAQYAAFVAEPQQQQKAADWDGNLIAARGTLVLTASGTGTASILILPAGRKLVYPHLSCISAPDGAAGADIDVGHAAYDAVSLNVDAFAASLDLGGGPLVNTELNIQSPVVVDSKEDVVVTISIDTANGLTGTYELVLVYARAGA